MFNMETIKELTECCICTDTFTDPRILSCIHTFCLKCLDKTALTRKLKPGDTMPCPLCRKIFVIPSDGMVGLQKNVFVERFVEISNLLLPPNSDILCDVCKNETPDEGKVNEIPTATQLCIQCKQNICERCCQYHKRIQELQRHEFIPIGSPLKDELMKNASLQYCDQHSKKERMYCENCRRVICMMCFAQNHKDHKCSDISDVANKFRDHIRRDLEKMNGYEAEAATKVEEIVKVKEDFQKNITDTERAILNRGIELKEFVDRCTKSLLDELSVINQRVSKEIAIQHEESEAHKMIINSFEKYCTEMESMGSNAEICRAADDLHARSEELKTLHEEQIHRQIFSGAVTFQASGVEDFLKKENIVGKLREELGNIPRQSSSFEVELQASDVEESLKKGNTTEKTRVIFRSIGKLTLTSGCFVRGVTKLQNKIYALCHNSDFIRVFDDQNPYKCQKDVLIEEVKDAWDIQCCEISKCLYISDSDNRCVWRMNVTDHRMTKVLTETQIVEPFTFSITNQGHLLILRRAEQLKQLEIYGSDAKVVHRILLPNGFFKPEYAIQKPNGDFIIIHRIETPDGPWTISRLTKKGKKVVARFFPKYETQVLNVPIRLALDSDNDRLIVADYLNDRLVVLDSLSLNLTNVFLTKKANGISLPSRLYYDKSKKQLIVGQVIGDLEVFEATRLVENKTFTN